MSDTPQQWSTRMYGIGPLQKPTLGLVSDNIHGWLKSQTALCWRLEAGSKCIFARPVPIWELPVSSVRGRRPLACFLGDSVCGFAQDNKSNGHHLQVASWACLPDLDSHLGKEGGGEGVMEQLSEYPATPTLQLCAAVF